jgi:pyruvate dehydrogenase E1 component alpha subunit
LLVAQTYRIEGHTVGDPLTYRPEGETEAWKAPDRDPISRFGRYLVEQEGFAEEDLEALEQQAGDEIGAAIEFALSSPDPEVASLWEDVYA